MTIMIIDVINKDRVVRIHSRASTRTREGKEASYYSNTNGCINIPVLCDKFDGATAKILD